MTGMKVTQQCLALLPATALEIAAELEREPSFIHNTLWNLGRSGKARKTDKRVRNGTFKQGAKASPIWERAC